MSISHHHIIHFYQKFDSWLIVRDGHTDWSDPFKAREAHVLNRWDKPNAQNKWILFQGLYPARKSPQSQKLISIFDKNILKGGKCIKLEEKNYVIFKAKIHHTKIYPHFKDNKLKIKT